MHDIAYHIKYRKLPMFGITKTTVTQAELDLIISTSFVDFILPEDVMQV